MIAAIYADTRPQGHYAGESAQLTWRARFGSDGEENPTWSFVCLPETVSPYGGLR